MFEILGEESKLVASVRAGSLLLKGRTRDGVDILDVEGELKTGDGVDAFETLIQAASGQKVPLVLNLVGLERIDSRGIGAIVDAKVKLGERVCMIHVSQRVRSLLAICKLASIMPNYADEAEAVACLRNAEQTSQFRKRSIAFFD